MEIKSHLINNLNIAEIICDEILIKNIENGLDLLGNLYYQGFDKIVIYEKNITPDFFDLKTKIAGEILQKFSNYRMSLIIIGDFSKYNSTSLKDFISESNRNKTVNFLSDIAEALK